MTFNCVESKSPDAIPVLDAIKGNSQIYITKFTKTSGEQIYMELGSGDDRASVWFSQDEFDTFIKKLIQLNESFKTVI
jgi:hypothetical protein